MPRQSNIKCHYRSEACRVGIYWPIEQGDRLVFGRPSQSHNSFYSVVIGSLEPAFFLFAKNNPSYTLSTLPLMQMVDRRLKSEFGIISLEFDCPK